MLLAAKISVIKTENVWPSISIVKIMVA